MSGVASVIPRDATRGGPRLGRVGLRAAGLLGAADRALLVEAAPQPGVDDRVRGPGAAHGAPASLERHCVTVQTCGPRPIGRAVVVANHVSYLGTRLVVSSVLPCVSVAKGEVRGWPLIGRGLEDLGVLFVRRGDPYSGARTIRAAVRAIADGAAVLNFPEGTTTDGLRVGPFSRGAFGIARIARVPVVPARIVYDDTAVAWVGGEAFVPHYLRVCRLGGVKATVRFGAPLEVAMSDDPAAVASRVREVVLSLST